MIVYTIIYYIGGPAEGALGAQPADGALCGSNRPEERAGSIIITIVLLFIIVHIHIHVCVYVYICTYVDIGNYTLL